jgi:hypothetical protein
MLGPIECISTTLVYPEVITRLLAFTFKSFRLSWVPCMSTALKAYCFFNSWCSRFWRLRRASAYLFWAIVLDFLLIWCDGTPLTVGKSFIYSEGSFSIFLPGIGGDWDIGYNVVVVGIIFRLLFSMSCYLIKVSSLFWSSCFIFDKKLFSEFYDCIFSGKLGWFTPIFVPCACRRLSDGFTRDLWLIRADDCTGIDWPKVTPNVSLLFSWVW